MSENQLSNDLKILQSARHIVRKNKLKLLELPKSLELLTQIQAKSDFSKTSITTFLENLQIIANSKKIDLENEEFAKLVLKFSIEICAKNKNKVIAIQTRFAKLFAKMSNVSVTFVKFLKQALKKINFVQFNALADFFGNINNVEVLNLIAERAKEELDKLETHKRAWNKMVFSIIDKSNQLETIVGRLRDSLRQSINVVNNLVEVFKNFDMKSITRKAEFDVVFDVSFNDAFTKDENLTCNLIRFAEKLLSSNECVQENTKSEFFLSSLSVKVNKNPSQEVHFAFCNLIANLNFRFSQKVQNDVLSQFVESLGTLKSTTEVNQISKIIASNKTMASIKSMDYLADRKKYNDFPISFFALASYVSEQAAYSKFLTEFYQKNKDNTAIFSNFKTYLFAFCNLVKTNQFNGEEQLNFIQRTLDSDDCFSKDEFFDTITETQLFAILEIISGISKDAIVKSSMSENEGQIFGYFCLTALRLYFKTESKLNLKFDKKILKMMLKSQLVIVSSERQYKHTTDKTDKVLRFILFESNFKTKNQLMFFKTLALISNDTLIEKSQLKILHKSEFFKSIPNAPLPKSLFRIFSTQNLFSKTDSKFWKAFLTNLIYFYPELIEKLLVFFSKKNLTFLLSMSQTEQQIEEIKPLTKVFFFEKSEFELIGIQQKVVPQKGKAKPQKEETFDDVDYIYSVTIDEHEKIEQNEDEKFDELKLENQKSQVMENYSHLLNQIGSVLYDFFESFSKQFNETHLKCIEAQLIFLKTTFKSVRYFSEILNRLYTFFLRFASNNQSPEFQKLLFYNLGIARNNDSPQYVRSVEYFIKKCDFSRIKVTSEVFEILNTMLNFVFENKIDTEYKKKLFYFIFQNLNSFPHIEDEFIGFVCTHFNELNFDEAYASFKSISQKLMKHNANIVDRFLYDILNYEDFVVRFLLKTLTEFSENGLLKNQQIPVLQLLKIMVLTENEDEEIAGLAQQLVVSNELFKFGTHIFDSLDFTVITKEFPVDMHAIIAKIIDQNFDLFDENQRSIFAKTLISQIKGVVLGAATFSEELKRENEPKYQIFPKILFRIIQKIKEDDILKIFEYIFGKIIRN